MYFPVLFGVLNTSAFSIKYCTLEAPTVTILLILIMPIEIMLSYSGIFLGSRPGLPIYFCLRSKLLKLAPRCRWW